MNKDVDDESKYDVRFIIDAEMTYIRPDCKRKNINNTWNSSKKFWGV